MTVEPRHCDECIDDLEQPECLRRWLGWARLPAACKYPPADEDGIRRWIEPALQPYVWRGPPPCCFADHGGERVQLVVASRFGDIVVSRRLGPDATYHARVALAELANFTAAAP